MKSRVYLLILFYSLLFLFYPGNSYYVDTFAYNRSLFLEQEKNVEYETKQVPYKINKYSSPQVTAQGVYIVDLSSFTPVFEKNARAKFSPASTVKIITALVSFDVYEMDDVLVVNRVVTDGQTMNLVKGEKITTENLLYGLLVHSGNDVAFVLADNYEEGFEKFIEEMNRKAEEIGMKDTKFKNPAGFDEFGQHTTPFDLSLAGRELLRNETLSKIVSTKSITVSDINFQYFHPLYNVNRLLGEIPGIGGLKTGFTLNAGENLVTFYKKPSLNDVNHEFLIVILKSEDRFKDTEEIVGWINANVEYINP